MTNGSDQETIERARNKWRSKYPLDTCSWSLLPNIGLKKSVVFASYAAWFIFAATFSAIHGEQWVEMLWWTLFGAFALRYILCRLKGGQFAIGAGAIMDEECPFQLRLLADCTFVLLMLVCFAFVTAGPQRMRSALVSLSSHHDISAFNGAEAVTLALKNYPIVSISLI